MQYDRSLLHNQFIKLYCNYPCCPFICRRWKNSQGRIFFHRFLQIAKNYAWIAVHSFSKSKERKHSSVKNINTLFVCGRRSIRHGESAAVRFVGSLSCANRGKYSQLQMASKSIFPHWALVKFWLEIFSFLGKVKLWH